MISAILEITMDNCPDRNDPVIVADEYEKHAERNEALEKVLDIDAHKELLCAIIGNLQHVKTRLVDGISDDEKEGLLIYLAVTRSNLDALINEMVNI